MNELFEFFQAVGETIEELATLDDLPGEEKRRRLGQRGHKLLEEGDDLTSLIPGLTGVVARSLVDNPGMDAAQKDFAQQQLGQWLYDRWQWWKGLWKQPEAAA
jgi:hypothetical protein